MHPLRFLDSTIDTNRALPGIYDPLLVVLSVLIAAMAAYAAFGLVERVNAAIQPGIRKKWFITGAVAMGVGIWAMHFIGMLAFKLPIPVTYDIWITLVSMIPGMIASGIVLYEISRAKAGLKQLILSGTYMGLGIGAMHYMGMAAMRIPGTMLYDPILFILSILVAVLLASFALHINLLAVRRQDYEAKVVAALVMGLAVAGMHYTGMFAVYFFPSDKIEPNEIGIDPVTVGILVALATILILSLATFVAMVGRRLDAAASSEQMAYDQLQKAHEALQHKNDELTQTLEELKSTQSQLIESEKLASLGQLTAGIVHEINNPMGALTSTTDTLMRCVSKMKSVLASNQAVDEEKRILELQKLLEILEQNGQIVLTTNDRIAKVISSLKNFTRLDESDYKKVDIHDGIESTVTLLQHEMHNGIQLVRSYGNIPEIRCYPGELNQMFMTLLSNAIQAIEEDGVISITTSTEDQHVIFEVSDTGRGMSTEQVKELFDLSFTTKKSRISMGMGLINAYHTIQKHNGDIRVDSDLGRGTTVRVQLPV